MPAPQIRSTEDETLHQEMERVSLDWCMVYNPTNEDFYIEWNNAQGRPWKYLVPNKNKDIGWGAGKLEVQRYLALWYCKHMKDKIVNDKGKAIADKMLQERQEKGQVPLTKSEEQTLVWGKTPRTTSNAEFKALYPILWLGVSREFGMDYQQNEPTSLTQATPEEELVKELTNKKYVPETKPEVKTTPKAAKPVESMEDLLNE